MRVRSDLETYHQRWKSMNAATFVADVQASVDDWHDYHEVADEHDARDPDGGAVHKIARVLQALPAGYRAVDLGCGRNRLRTLVPALEWTSVDAVAADATVKEHDLGCLPREWDQAFDVAILSRALWARNSATVVAEAHRVLKQGGSLVVCESFRRWWDAGAKTNTLQQLLCSHGFVIQTAHGASPTDDTTDVFQYFVCVKPRVSLAF